MVLWSLVCLLGLIGGRPGFLPADFIPGSLDTDFHPGSGANDYVYTLALQPDGNILISGWFNNFFNWSTVRNGILLLNPDGPLIPPSVPAAGRMTMFGKWLCSPMGRSSPEGPSPSSPGRP